jgi:SNF2 family DNA or RNA helicase
MPSSWYSALYDDQKPAADFVVQRLAQGGGAALLCDPGTGKTIVSLAALERLGIILRPVEPFNILIVTPLTSVEVTWAKRLRSSGYEVSLSAVEHAQGVLVIGYEHFRANIKQILKRRWDIAIFDESQGLKSRSSQQSRGVRRLRLKIPRRLILSGTPIDESPIDFWAQMRFVEPSVLGDVWSPPRDPRKRKGHYFEEEFCRPCGFMGRAREFIPSKMPEFLERIAPYVYRLELQMEKPEFIEVPVNILGRQRRVYQQMMDHGIVHYDGEKVKAGMAATRDLRGFQILGGYLALPDGAVKVGDAKQRKLRWLLPRLERPVVFCRFLSEVNEVRDILAEEFHNVATLNGSVKDTKKDKRRTQLIEDFQAKKIDALACQARTGGVSIELSSTSELVFYSMGYSYIDFQQIIARFRRHGQKKRVKVFLIIAQNTIDEDPLDRILEKGETVDPIMDHLRESSMAEAKKGASKKKAAPAKADTADNKLPVGIDYVAKKMGGVTPVVARQRLRNANVKKLGGSWGWPTKAAADADVAKCAPKAKKAA